MIIFRSTAILSLFMIASFSRAQEGRSMQGAFGTVTIDGKMWNQISLRPVVPLWKFALALDLVFYFDQDGTQRQASETPSLYLRKLHHVQRQELRNNLVC